ncbi:hypothetical protein [Cytobacillus oceanisediminis]|uniref:hypothetical protein n=1 Tax=Cytobacillus oceanisediminis TaxID=665099 RepID=UPI002079298B|nr:hypothetical protein [Cytobacillus oceanisediminis]USK44664.1 hypothetical protein LIT27_01845 [Cytobacillus oceanisediminis]
MKRDLSSTKNIIKYLEGRYGKFHNQTFCDDLTFIKNVKSDHTYEQLVMMKRRIDGSISVKKDANSMSINPITMLPVFLTLLITIILGFSTISSNAILSYLTNSVNLNRETMSQEQLTKIINSLNFTDIFNVIMNYFGLFCIVILFSIFYLGGVQIKAISKLYTCSILLEEAIASKEQNETT